MMKAQITDKLVDFANAAVGQFKGGLGYVKYPDLHAFWRYPGLRRRGCLGHRGNADSCHGKNRDMTKDYAVAVTAGSSMLSPIIPPSIAMILYSFYTETPVAKLFLGGLVPGILIGIMQCGVNYVSYRKTGI